MKSLAAVFVLALIVVWPGAVRSNEIFKSDELKFEIRFPAEPQRQSRTQKFTSGEAQIVRFKSMDQQLRPSLSVIVFSRAPFTTKEIAAGLEISGARQAAGLKGTIVSHKQLVVNGIAGKETIIKSQSQGHTFFYRAQTFYAGNRQYILSVVAEKLKGVTDAADGYFGSFKLWD